MNTKQPSVESLSIITAPTSLPPLETPQPPSFPTFTELVEEDLAQQETPRTKRLLDLFDGTLGDPTPLIVDYQKHPEKYGQEVHDLLEQLMQGSKSVEQLTKAERHLLNLATWDYYSAVPLKKDPPTTHGSNKARPKRPSRQRKVVPKRAKPRPGADVPVTELPAYWWLQ